ncbi:biliverdin-producing heme oxygenase [Microbulbifer sp. 2304DJ12-6]|uniref:biliverdin-producing heme oxygenase n=1 Tax=Microbulbifer sp. 2304DJ12-6 TaxID=3233340 RepID=UPI0039AF749B
MTEPAETLSDPFQVPALSACLKAGTHSIHERLDTRIMSLSVFSSRERYALFVRTQSRLHHAVARWFENARLQNWLPELPQRNRLWAVVEDCRDIGLTPEALSEDREVAAQVQILDIYSALGWLYVVEGSNLGAAFLLKQVKKLDLSETFGARHLAANEMGRGLHWRKFKNALDALELAGEQREAALKGAIAAFAFARQNVEQLLASPEN